MAKRVTGGRKGGTGHVSAGRAAAGQMILGFLDRIDEAMLAGWAVDPSNVDRPLTMRVMIDGHVADVIQCELDRPDLHLLSLTSTRVGFEYAIPARYQDGLRHVLTLSTLHGEPVHLPGRGGLVLPELHFCLTRRVRIESVLDGLVDGVIQGWVLQIDERTGAKTGGTRVLISTDGQPVAEVLADQFRADVAEALDADPACGFSWSPPSDLRRGGGTITFDFHAKPSRTLLRGSPLEVRVPGRIDRTRIEALIERADELFRFAYHLRRELKAVLPAEGFSLADYQGWAAHNRPTIPARIAARYGTRADRTLVSIVCPVYRPEPGDFLAAIDSVRAQTYPNWELILVDDASRDATLSKMMAEFAAADPRIHVHVQQRNGGISTATNRAIEKAKGAFIAFFDHDDMLEPCAIDAMMRAQAATGARLLYSDEDKIDRAGNLSEPNLKPDLNYRLLLGQNYICHLVLAETALVRELGGLDPLTDGAQDHDLLLRACERLGSHEIHHVPEILYHWRITPKSTAGAGSAKPRAAIAGETALKAHLKRRGLPAKVERRGDRTCYRTDFRMSEDPGISILIPFRDHITMTKQCIDAIRRLTRGVRFEIILIDNWSQDAETEIFCAEQANRRDTRVVRVPEPFNFSRINNKGVAAAQYPFLLFMNNDVFVNDADWLRSMLNEALADPGVGAVGPKLVYPNRTVQHGGVVIGVGGIAEHAFRGIGETMPGYLARAISTAEVSAVTAACMLVRREAFDRAGGFDAAELAVAFNDVDLCLKMRQAGYRIIFAPDIVCEHRESLSRGDDFDESKLGRFMQENETMHLRWNGVLEHDPYYNRHFSRDGGIYRDLRIIDPADETCVKRPKPASRPVAPLVAVNEPRSRSATESLAMKPATAKPAARTARRQRRMQDA